MIDQIKGTTIDGIDNNHNGLIDEPGEDDPNFRTTGWGRPVQRQLRRRVPYSLALGVFMAVFDIIPLVGATIGSFVVVASGLIFVDVRTAVILFAIVMVYQQIENHILQPMIYGRTVQIPSLTILVAVLAGGAALGLVGALLAIPIAATIQAVIKELLEERAMRMDELPSGDV